MHNIEWHKSDLKPYETVIHNISPLYVLILYVCVCFQEQIHVPVYHPTPSQARLATQLTEEEQVRIAQRIGLIQHLPKGVYDPGSDGTEKKIRE